MKLSPTLDLEKIEQMKAGIPDINVYVEYSGEGPLEKVDADPRLLFPTDSELDWKMGKLTEKFKKLMKK